MKQSLSQYQVQNQQQVQVQTLSPQQVLQVRVLELSLNELEERVRLEMDDNPALEIGENEADMQADEPTYDDLQGEETYDSYEQEERRDALQDVLMSIGADDEMPNFSNRSDEEQEVVFGATRSFQDELKEQMCDYELNDNERYVLEYLIGSLDDDGYLRRDTEIIAEELALYHNIDVDANDVNRMLKVLQSMEPAGIGAHNLQECLLLQTPPQGKVRHVITNMFREFTLKHWDKIQRSLKLNDEEADELFRELRRLNPKPGSSFNEVMGKSMQQITPDFVVDTNDDGTISFYVNKGNLPVLTISDTFEDILNDKGNSKSLKEARNYARSKIDSANDFIEAVRLRYQTMYAVMKAIIEWQRRFFEDGDEMSMKPMILKDIAERIGMDISTVSRATNGKYVQTRWGIFPLKMLFNDGYVTADGEETSTIAIKQALKEIIDSENKKKPLSDEKLTSELAKRGFPIARRTVAKYREQLNIPVARLRK